MGGHPNGSRAKDDPWQLTTPPGSGLAEVTHDARNNQMRAR